MVADVVVEEVSLDQVLKAGKGSMCIVQKERTLEG